MKENLLAEANPINIALYENEARRIAQLFGLYDHMSDPNIGPANIWISKMIQRGETTAIANLLIKHGIFTADEYFQEATKHVSEELDRVQKEYGLIITAEGIASKPKGEPDGGADSKVREIH